MRNIVVWSGGYDSTLVLHNLAKASSKENSVIALYVDWKGKLNSLKVIKEKEVMKNYLAYAKQKGFHIKFHTVTFSSTLGIYGYGHTQACLWVCAVMPFIETGDRVYFGYHERDRFWSCNSQVYHAFENMFYIRSLKDVKIVYPLEYKSKCEVLQEINKLKIPKKCFWTCENPVRKGKNIVKCGNCDPCINHRLALYERKIRR